MRPNKEIMQTPVMTDGGRPADPGDPRRSWMAYPGDGRVGRDGAGERVRQHSPRLYDAHSQPQSASSRVNESDRNTPIGVWSRCYRLVVTAHSFHARKSQRRSVLASPSLLRRYSGPILAW
jgi:hypothetical protein